MHSQVDLHKSAFIKARIKEMQAFDPKLSFPQAWERLRKEKPELFVEQPGWDPETGEYGAIRQPHTSGYNNPYSRDALGRTSYYGEPLPPSLPRSREKGKVNAEVKTPFLDLLVAARQMKIPVRVEASRGDSIGALELSDEHGSLLREWVELQGYELVEVI
jgi:hypothetical protein